MGWKLRNGVQTIVADRDRWRHAVKSLCTTAREGNTELAVLQVATVETKNYGD